MLKPPDRIIDLKLEATYPVFDDRYGVILSYKIAGKPQYHVTYRTSYSKESPFSAEEVTRITSSMLSAPYYWLTDSMCLVNFINLTLNKNPKPLIVFVSVCQRLGVNLQWPEDTTFLRLIDE